MNDLRKITLRNEIDFLVGFPFKSEGYTSEGVRLLRGDNIAQGTLSWSNAKKWPTSQRKDFEPYELREGDIVLAMDRPWIDAGLKYASVSRYDLPCLLVQRTARLRGGENLDTNFLRYLIGSPQFAKYIKCITTGSLVPHISGDQIKDFSVHIPHLDIQKKIAAVLSSIDAKINCNKRINAELEAMTKMLYDYWFVQFDFPDTNGKPYKSSGGKMVYNATLKREIPSGWQALELSEVISRSGTGLNPRDNFQLGHGNNYYVTIKNVTNGKITLDDKCDRVDDEALKIIDRRSQLQVGDVLFTSIEPVGVTYLIHKKPENWNINESVFTIRPDYKKTTSEHLFCLLSSSEMKVFTKNSSAGSIHKGIRHGVLKTYPLAYGNKVLVDDFSLVVKPMLKQMDVLENESQQLTQLRDWLLPLLMNGQVTVA